MPVPETIESLDERVAEAAEAYAARAPGSFAIVDPADPDRFLGIISWRLDAHAALQIADIGYGVHADSRGRGVARRAIRAFVRWLTTDVDGPRMVRVQLDHSVENVASCRVALAAGLELEGVRRGFLPLRDPAAPGRGTSPRRVPARRRGPPTDTPTVARGGHGPFTSRSPAGHTPDSPAGHGGGMRIALVTEQFVPASTPAAHVTREVTSRLVDAGHDVVVFAGGRGQATFRGARMFWASRMTPVSAIREAMTLSRPDIVHLVDPHRLGIKAAEAAERLGVPTAGAGPAHVAARGRPARPPPRPA